VDITDELRRAIAVANAENEPSNCVSRFLSRQFGKRNARLLLRDAHGAVTRLHKAHRAMKLAIKSWDGSSRNTDQIVRAAVAYIERMHDTTLLCNAPPIQPPIQMAMTDRRKERAAYHRGRPSPKAIDATAK